LREGLFEDVEDEEDVEDAFFLAVLFVVAAITGPKPNVR
jgi:hypothetical protein